MLTAIRLAFLAALFLAPIARADLVYADPDGDTVTVHQTADCPPEIATRAAEGMRGYYVAATVTIDGRSRRACAALVTVPGGNRAPQVHVIVEGMGDDVFPLTDFKLAAERPSI